MADEDKEQPTEPNQSLHKENAHGSACGGDVLVNTGQVDVENSDRDITEVECESVKIDVHNKAYSEHEGFFKTINKNGSDIDEGRSDEEYGGYKKSENEEKVGMVKDDKVDTCGEHPNGTETDGNDDESSEDENEGVPTDAGWSLVIAACMFFIMILLASYDQFMSVLFVDFVELFQAPLSQMTSIFTVYFMVGSVSCLVTSNFLVPKWSLRTLTIVGGLLYSLSTLLYSLAPNANVFLSSFACKGVGWGMLMVCPPTVLGQYFKKRRSLAQAVANLGVPLAFMTAPHVAQALRSEFGVRGALMIFAGLELHYIPLAMLMRPTEQYRERYRRRRQKAMDIKNRVAVNSNGLDSEKKSLLPKHELNNSNTIQNSNRNNKDMLRTQNHDINHKFNHHFVDVAKPVFASWPRLGFETNIRKCSVDSYYDTSNKNVREYQKHEQTSSLFVLNSISSVGEEKAMSGLNATNSEENLQRSLLDGQNSGTFVNSKIASSAPSIFPLTSVTGSSLEIVDTCKAEQGEDNNKVKTCGDKLKEIFDISLFKIWLFRMFVVAAGCSVFSSIIVVYMPTMAVRDGLSRTQAASLLSVVGVMDMIARTSMGYIADTGKISKARLISISFGAVSLLCHSVGYFTSSYPAMLVFAVLTGCFISARHNLQNPLLIEYVGIDCLPRALGILMVTVSTAIAINHPIVGSLVDATGDFVIPLHYVGTFAAVCSILMALEPVFKRLDQKAKDNDTRKNAFGGDEVTSAHNKC